MKKWVLGIIIAAGLMVLIILSILIYNQSTKIYSPESPSSKSYCIGNSANIQSISCTKTNAGYLIQAKLNYSGYYNNSDKISKIAFVLDKDDGANKVKFLNFSSSEYTFKINNSEAVGLKKIGVALVIKHSNYEIDCEISDTKNITCS